MTIVTALSLEKPVGKSELERHFLEPLVARVFGDYPDLDYVKDLRGGTLPPHIEVHEFFMKTGDYLGNLLAQQQYISTNDTFVARDMLVQGMNVIAQAVAQRHEDGHWWLSLSSNPDIVAELVERCTEAGQPLLKVGVVNGQMPYMRGGAEVEPGFFDIVVTDLAATHHLFSPPNGKVSTADYAIGLHASSLVVDGGTLQAGRVRSPLSTDDLEFLQRVGVFKPGTRLQGDTLVAADGMVVANDLLSDSGLQAACTHLLGARLTGGVFMTGGFVLGPNDFYERLRNMPPQELARIDMTRIDFINQLYGRLPGEADLKRAQRRKARFMNITMVVTLLGAAASDALESGQVVAGVGGKNNFVAMAHAIPDARSILMLRATHDNKDGLTSSIVFSYGNTTIPRHLRDILITEYGVADLRGQGDSEVVKRLIGVVDSRFQPQLMAQARDPVELVQMAIKSLWSGKQAPPEHLQRPGLDDATSFKDLFIRKLFAGDL